MADTELLIPLAEIAGVFVGFGALIAVRSGGASDRFEVAYMRGVVSWGLLTIVAALAPVTLSRYDLGDHEVWALSSVVVLVGWVLMSATNAWSWTPEWRRGARADDWTAGTGSPPRRLAGLILVVAGAYLLAAVLLPIVVLLGVAPYLDAALYFSAVVLILLWGAWLLMQMVFRERGPQGS